MSLRLGVVVGEGETWHFFQDVYQDLTSHYQVKLFERRRLRSPIFYFRIDRFLVERELRRFMSECDVIFFEWASELLAFATTLPKVCRIVTRLHRYEWFEWSARVNWDAVDKIIFVSHAFERKFQERFPAHAAKTVVIPVGVSLARFQPKPKEFGGDLGILAQLAPRKRIYDLILNFADLVPQRPRFHLHIGGAPNAYHADYVEALYHLVAKLRLTQAVTFYGKVEDTPQWFERIDVFVSHSYSEGLQVAPMEAMASGKYCVSHFWDGADDLLPSECLYMTPGEFQEKILAYYDAPEAEKQQKQADMRALACKRFEQRQIQSEIRRVIETC